MVWLLCKFLSDVWDKTFMTIRWILARVKKQLSVKLRAQTICRSMDQKIALYLYNRLFDFWATRQIVNPYVIILLIYFKWDKAFTKLLNSISPSICHWFPLSWFTIVAKRMDFCYLYYICQKVSYLTRFC